MEYQIQGAIKIKDGLFIGDEVASQDLEFIVSNKVTHIINCAAKELPNAWESYGINYLNFFWQETDNQIIFDNKDENINKVFSFIENSQNLGESCLVNSVRGQSRSCCVLVAYFMKKYHWTLYKTLEFLNSRRPNLEIRASFFHQLTNLEVRLQKFGPKSASWNELAEEDNNLDNEELLIRNTFLNAKNMSIAEIFKEKPALENSYMNKENKVNWIDEIQVNNSEAIVVEFNEGDPAMEVALLGTRLTRTSSKSIIKVTKHKQINLQLQNQNLTQQKTDKNLAQFFEARIFRANSTKNSQKESCNLSFQDSKTTYAKNKQKKDVSFTQTKQENETNSITKQSELFKNQTNQIQQQIQELQNETTEMKKKLQKQQEVSTVSPKPKLRKDSPMYRNTTNTNKNHHNLPTNNSLNFFKGQGFYKQKSNSTLKTKKNYLCDQENFQKQEEQIKNFSSPLAANQNINNLINSVVDYQFQNMPAKNNCSVSTISQKQGPIRANLDISNACKQQFLDQQKNICSNTKKEQAQKSYFNQQSIKQPSNSYLKRPTSGNSNQRFFSPCVKENDKNPNNYPKQNPKTKLRSQSPQVPQVNQQNLTTNKSNSNLLTHSNSFKPQNAIFNVNNLSIQPATLLKPKWKM